MDPRAINKTIELYRAKAEKVRAEYRSRQLAEQAAEESRGAGEGAGGPADAEVPQTQDAHQESEQA